MLQIYMKLMKSLIKIEKKQQRSKSEHPLWRSNPPILSPSFKKIEEIRR